MTGFGKASTAAARTVCAATRLPNTIPRYVAKRPERVAAPQTRRRMHAEAVPSAAGPGPLDVFFARRRPNFQEALAKISQLRHRYRQDRSLFIPGRHLLPILQGLGGREEEAASLQRVSDRLYADPTLPFRKSRNGRFCYDFDTETIRRLEFQPFALSLDEDFKRHDSDQVRIFDQVEHDLQSNTLFQALLVFKGMMFSGIPTQPRPKLAYEANQWITTVFNLRTITSPALLGQPALEGVHTDGVDHTMTTFLGSRNMTHDSGVTLIHDMAETTGIQFDETKTELLKDRYQHKHFLDTVLIVDHELKHSVTPVHAQDPSRDATRDMLIFFTRKPTQPGHVSSSIDSLRSHPRLKMEMPLLSFP